MSSVKKGMIGILTAERKFLDDIRVLHIAWADQANDVVVARAHLEMVNLFQQTLNQYNDLLDMYKKSTEEKL